eukprot:GHUV01004917.1.p1 GENE.GHUV01004917.1~~GHUV01004917.1.p1  ORF type:complete len:339 (+),score=73.34 GHUV01004917.1:140-1018(+)
MSHMTLLQSGPAATCCVYAFGSGRRMRTQCVRVRASAESQRSDESSRVNRRQLIAGSLLLSPLLLSRSAVADEVAAAEQVAAAAADVVAAAPAASEAAAASEVSEKVTSEGAIRLATDDVALKNLTPTNRQIFALNKRVQAQNRAPDDFPGFIREGFDVTVVGEGYVMDNDGLIFKDFVVGNGTQPVDGQQVVFDYTAYNESGAAIDSSYRKGRPAETRLGISGLIPGFELGIKGMKPGGKRRIVVPPALGPPVGPSTFFSAKQCEVFDVELRKVRACERRQMLMFSDVVCE